MEDLGKGLEKLVKAGIGAVSEGLDFTQDMIDRLAAKGEPLYNQARSSVDETAEKIRETVRKAMSGQELDDIKHSLALLKREEMIEIADFLRELIAVTGEKTDPESGAQEPPEEENKENENKEETGDPGDPPEDGDLSGNG